MIHTLEWTDSGVRFIDQTKLPIEETYVTCKTYEQVADAIRNMVVRGAPAIGVAAAADQTGPDRRSTTHACRRYSCKPGHGPAWCDPDARERRRAHALQCRRPSYLWLRHGAGGDSGSGGAREENSRLCR